MKWQVKKKSCSQKLEFDDYAGNQRVSNFRETFKWRLCDTLLAVVIAASALLVFLFRPIGSTGGQVALISVNGAETGRVSLVGIDNIPPFSVGVDYECLLEIKEGKIRVLSAGCPDKLCVHMGWINHPGQAIICVPAKVVITIEGEGEYDVISQ